ncbi:MAG: helix-turn-helix domain-containing protein [Thermoanaerobaculia bacterium]|nr:helix-turn-helix domain-containing protein [Thermoanaerobaculia bacterium]
MPQILKHDVRERIEAAAAAVFASRGFVAASMSEIADRAGISAGNIYRYFDGKEALFDAVIDDELARSFLDLLRQRVEASNESDDPVPSQSDLYRLASERLLAFSIANRHRVVALLGGNRGSRLEGYDETVVDELSRLAIRHFRGRHPGLRIPAQRRFTLDRIYRAFIDSMVAVLSEHDEEGRIRSAVSDYTAYHLAGLEALFAPDAISDPDDQEASG